MRYSILPTGLGGHSSGTHDKPIVSIVGSVRARRQRLADTSEPPQDPSHLDSNEVQTNTISRNLICLRNTPAAQINTRATAAGRITSEGMRSANAPA
jgi:hypothetical protein